MFRKYQFSVDIWGLILFAAVMVPNLIWFAVPAPHDVLREAPAAGILDTIASVCQVFMVAALCAFKNRECPKIRVSPLIILVFVCCALYFASWIFYYNGMIQPFILWGLMVPPCLAFLFFAVDRKNGLAILPILIFTVCHAAEGACRFIF